MALICVIISLSATAQTRISSVYGVNLGDSESTVTSKISGSWKTNSKGVKYYKTTNPTLGSCTFQQATFWFKSGKLYRVSFSSGDGGAMDANFQNAYGGSNGYDQFISNSERFRKTYKQMYSNLSSKYGRPSIEDEDKAIWKSNGNMIELTYEFNDTVNQYGWHDGWTSVNVIYSVAGASSSNF